MESVSVQADKAEISRMESFRRGLVATSWAIPFYVVAGTLAGLLAGLASTPFVTSLAIAYGAEKMAEPLTLFVFKGATYVGTALGTAGGAIAAYNFATESDIDNMGERAPNKTFAVAGMLSSLAIGLSIAFGLSLAYSKLAPEIKATPAVEKAAAVTMLQRTPVVLSNDRPVKTSFTSAVNDKDTRMPLVTGLEKDAYALRPRLG